MEIHDDFRRRPQESVLYWRPVSAFPCLSSSASLTYIALNVTDTTQRELDRPLGGVRIVDVDYAMGGQVAYTILKLVCLRFPESSG